MLVILRGISGSGKSTVASRFKPHQVLSSDKFREMVGGNAINQNMSKQAFNLLFEALKFRMQCRLFTIIDATNLKNKSFARYIELAKQFGNEYVVVSIESSVASSWSRVQHRANKGGLLVPEYVINEQEKRYQDATQAVTTAHGENHYVALSTQDAYEYIRRVEIGSVNKYVLDRTMDEHLWAIGDVHGHDRPLRTLLRNIKKVYGTAFSIVQMGDIIDRGQNVEQVLDLLDKHSVITLMGNHELNFLMEHYGYKDCNSKERQITHENLSVDVKARLVNRIKSSPHWLLAKLKHQDWLMSHSGINPAVINSGVEFGANDTCMNNSSLSDSIPNIRQVYGHRSWDFSPIVDQLQLHPHHINVDSGYYKTQIMTAYDLVSNKVLYAGERALDMAIGKDVKDVEKPIHLSITA